MPETRGRDLEAIMEMFTSHSARDIPVLRALTGFGSRIKRMAGLGGGPVRRSTVLDTRGYELENRG
jgi:hypothetical protein